jgi:two-component system phosphate regulon sensor histidine kinase PhoR
MHDFETIADEKQLSLTIEGPAVEIQGHAFLLQELFHNLIENAMKYTPENGSVNILITENPDSIACAVSDTGIGIPKEHHARIFERFYRVDKSHSRSTGGTGLGLAIVKHAAEIHNASLDLISEEGKGTIITVTFPK